jgi:putative acetyltransferase
MTRKADNNDFNFIYALYMHPQVNPYLLYELMDANSFDPIYKNLIKQQLIYVYSRDHQPVGMFKLMPLEYRSDHIVYLGGLAIDPACAGRGEGIKMMNEIIALAVKLGFLRIELSVAVNNEKAIALYEKAGFQKEGVLRRYTHLKSKQLFIDEVMMSYLV